LAAALVAAAWVCAGCVGPQAIRSTRLQYNEVYRKTTDEQLLLNIVRLRYGDSAVLIDLPTITGQFEVNGIGGYNSPVTGAIDPGIPNFGVGQLVVRDSPTLSYHPREGHEIAETLVNPINPEVIRVISPGTDTLQFLMMAVNEINDVTNAPLATSLAPRTPDENSQFRMVAELLVGIQERGGVELSLLSFEADAFDPIPLEQLTGADQLAAAKEGYSFTVQGEVAALRKRQRAMALKFRPNELLAPDVVQVVEMLGLRPGQTTYRLRSEQTSEVLAGSLPEALGSDTLTVEMRSIMDMMVFLSKGVCVPSEHVARGVAPITRGFDSPVHDWTGVTRGLFAVRSQKHKPKHADIAVQYRGFWYYLDESDVISRSTLTLLEMLLELQEVDRDTQAPLLTLPL
jgi:hypothetical protein